MCLVLKPEIGGGLVVRINIAGFGLAASGLRGLAASCATMARAGEPVVQFFALRILPFDLRLR